MKRLIALLGAVIVVGVVGFVVIVLTLTGNGKPAPPTSTGPPITSTVATGPTVTVPVATTTTVTTTAPTTTVPATTDTTTTSSTTTRTTPVCALLPLICR